MMLYLPTHFLTNTKQLDSTANFYISDSYQQRFFIHRHKIFYSLGSDTLLYYCRIAWKSYLILHCVINSEFSVTYLYQCFVVISQRWVHIASFFRLALAQIFGTEIHCYMRNVVLVTWHSLIVQIVYFEQIIQKVYKHT